MLDQQLCLIESIPDKSHEWTPVTILALNPSGNLKETITVWIGALLQSHQRATLYEAGTVIDSHVCISDIPL